MTATSTAVVIVGAGPAGITAALWLRDLDVPFVWLGEPGRLGGTLLRVGNPLRNVPGVLTLDGPSLVHAFREQLAQLELAPLEATVHSVVARDHVFDVETSVGAFQTSHVLLCTGTQPRLPGLPEEAELLGQGVEISVTRTRARYAGQPVVVVGGGDAAAEGALLLAEVCPRVDLLVRGQEFRAQPRFVERILSSPRIHVHWGTSLVGYDTQGGRLVGVRLADGRQLSCTGVFVRIGVEARLPAQTPDMKRDSAGYIVVDVDGCTSAQGIWAAGDVTGAAFQSVAWAAGQAARAAWMLAQRVR